MIEQDVKDSYWHGWDTCVKVITEHFQEIKKQVEEQHGDQEGVDFTLTYLDNSIEITQSFLGVRESVERASQEKAEQQNDQSDQKIILS